jgi:hypothetical protein
MKELLVARRGLVKDRVAAANRNHVHRSPLLKRLADQRLRQVERQIAAIDAALRALCRADAEMQARLDILVSIPAIGEASALTMLIEMPELGTKPSPRWPASPRSPATQASTAENASYAPDALTCAKPSTCQPWWRSGSMQT